MEDIKLKYLSKIDEYILNYFDNTINLKKKLEYIKIGTFTKDNELLIVNWTKDFKEEFKKTNLDNEFNIYTIIIDNKLYYIENNYIIDQENRYELKILNMNEIAVKFKFYFDIYKLDDKIYNLNTDNYVKQIFIKHNSWSDYCFLNTYDKTIYRKDNLNEHGNYIFENKKLKINWVKWDPEFFIEKDNIYYLYITKEYNFYHINWTNTCIIENKNIIKQSIDKDIGIIKNDKFKLEVNWEKWNKEIFYFMENEYFSELFIYYLNENKIFNFKNYSTYQILDNNLEKDGTFIIDNNNIEINENDKIEKYYFKIENKKIFLLKEIEKEIIIVKKYDKKIKIYLFDIHNDKEIKYEEELYVLVDNKYYFKNYLDFNKEIIIIDKFKNKFYYKINLFYDYLYDDLNKISFIENNNNYFFIINNSIDKYILFKLENNNFLVSTELNIDLDFEYEIYRIFNDCNYKSKLDIFYDYLNNVNGNYSINSFLENNKFFNIEGYINNNSELNLNNKIDAIIHFIKNKYSFYFYSNENIEIIYEKYSFKTFNFKFDSDSDDDSEFEVNKIYDNMIFIINIETINDIIELIDLLPKNNLLILNIYIDFNIIEKTIENELIDKYENIIITKSYNLNNYNIIHFISKNIIIKNKLYTNKIIYIKNFNDNIYRNFLNKINFKNNKIILLDEDKSYYVFNENNYFKKLMKYCYTISDLIEILIYFYLSNRNLYKIFNKNLIISYKNLEYLCNDIFSETVPVLV